MPSLLGIDSGLTVTKAALFDVDGRVLGLARRRVAQSKPRPRHVERDPDTLWRATAGAVREALERGGRPASDVAAVAATAHGDGLYVLDAQGRPLGPGILSLDSRAGGIVAGWQADGIAADALPLTGQVPHAASPAALLAWLRVEAPERYAGIAHVIGCKDWLRYCLTGTIGTDRTEASAAFCDVRTQGWSRDALALFGLGALETALPEVAHPAAIVGHVTREAAALTGLRAGTPVAAGLHDVTASALGIGAHVPGVLGIVAGTYSINEVVSDRPVTDPRWFCRSGIAPGTSNAMAISPASTAAYDWMVETLTSGGPGIHDALAGEIDAALARPSGALFHPYLFGSPYGPEASGAFFGLRGWHDRGDVFRAVLEGIAFNHRHHADALREGFAFTEARLTGGVSRNPAVAQMFADVLDLPVTVAAVEEPAAWGAALCAGAAAGLYASVHDGPAPPPGTRHEPRGDAGLEARYRLHGRLAEAMRPFWPEVERLAEGG